MARTVGEKSDDLLNKDTREYLNQPEDEDNFADRVERMIEDMRKEKARGK